ncbi:hypothetical protein [Kitasatospora sp. NPDC057541]|uniref:hypothetical protein n=1 Tax=unclassified Kitasatospora TaxID=2633591 RepID=UPI0036798A49
MIILLGLIILVAAAVVAVAGILGNTGSGHGLTDTFTVFGHHMTGSTGTLFLYGIVVGAVGMLGLGLLLVGARRAANTRRGLRHSRKETATASRRRDELVEQRDSARAEATAMAKDRDNVAQERNTLAEQRDDLMSRQLHTNEQTAGTRLTPMPQGTATPSARMPQSDAEPAAPMPPDDVEPEPDNGHRRPHLLLGRGSGRQ